VTGRVLHGWAVSHLGESRGITEMEEGLAVWGSVTSENTHTYQPYFLALLAEANARVGEAEKAAALLAAMSSAVERTGEHFYEAELYRLKAELLLASPSGLSDNIATEAQTCLEQSIAIASSQGAKSLELRSTIRLCRLFCHQHNVDQARRRLSETVAWFTEGFETRDLKLARSLLEEIR